jgi:hypothetical protein
MSLQDPELAKSTVALQETTARNEELQEDLERAGIKPYAYYQ